MADKSTKSPLIPILILAVVVIGGLYLLSGGNKATEPQTPAPTATPAPGAPAQAPAGTAINSGVFGISLKNASGAGCAVSGNCASVALFLDSKTHWKGNERDTKYGIMQILQEQGIDGLTAYGGGTPAEISVTNDANLGDVYTANVVGKVGDTILVFTQVDTTPAAGEEATSAKLITFSDFYRETGTWVASVNGGAATWSLYKYIDATLWEDGNGAKQTGYNLNNASQGSVNKVLSWYSSPLLVGEQVTDGAIYVKLNTSMVGFFKSLAVTDKKGNTVKFTTLGKAENFQSDDPRYIASSTLPTISAVGENYYFVGYLPDKFVSLRNTADANRLSYELNVNVPAGADNVQALTFYTIQNAYAKTTANGAFPSNTFVVTLNSAAANGFV